MIRLFWKYLPLQAMFFYRIGAWAHRKKIRGLPSLLQKFVAIIYGLELSTTQDLGGGLYIPHPFGTTISVRKMGKNCTVIGSVTIGMRNERAFPIIGDNVFMGAGARVLGDIVVGEDAVIGANAVVIEDVPPGATVVGVPGKVIRIRNANNGES
jgi:serine O-acetyltransferase